ncbi:MAG TPA: Ig-like domain-containing protein [Mycobacteriales bacterium]|nr:Ig-like domain-containing protein [Mycobacteriales bacterium]
MAVLASPLAIGSAAAASPTNIILTPSGSVTANTGTCSAFNVVAQDTTQPGNSAAGETATLTVTETTTTSPAANSITLYSATGNPATCGAQVAQGGTTVNNGNGTYTTTLTRTETLDANGDDAFGVSSAVAGTGSVKVSSSATTSAQTNVTWTTGGADAVKTLTANPTTTTQYAGSTATYTVKATDANGNPVQGVTVNESSNPNVVNAGPDSIAPTACGTTDSTGSVTCTVHSGGTAGTDSIVFFVNNDNGTVHTGGADAGEPQTVVTAVFTPAPAVSAAKSSVTCVDKLSGANQNTAQTSCTVPTTQNSVVFTATVEDANGNPISGANVNFTTTSAKLGGATVTGSNLTSGTVVTGANGQATFTVNDPSAVNGDNATVSASVAGTSIGSATAHWATPVATTLSVQPAVKSVQVGGTVTVTATVQDQFGNPVSGSPTLTYVVTGRNLGKTGTAGAGGVITYTDAGTVPASHTDTISVTDATDHLSGSATVQYTTVAPVASTVVVDTSGHGTATSCGSASDTAATGVAAGAVTPVCALVEDSAGEPIAGDNVTFTVSNGTVGAHGATGSTTTTYQATTNGSGIAVADVSSTKSGAQTVTATADGKSGSNTVTYAAPTPAQAYSVAVSPSTAAIAAGGSQKFTATVTDKNGNPVPGVAVVYTQTGVGTVGNGANQVITASDGTVNVTVTTASTDTGSGAISFSIANASPANQCATTGGACTASATYTVAPAGASALVLRAPANGRAGNAMALTAHAANAGGAPMAGQIVRFYVGIGGKAVAIGSGTTGPAGNTTVRYTPTSAGKLTFAAFVDTNGDQIREANEPTANATVSVNAGVRAEHPVLSLDTRAKNAHQGFVTIHVTGDPAARSALVRYYQKINGRWHQIRANYIGPGGRHAKVVITRAKGKRLTFRVRVAATSSTRVGTSVAKTITVK